MNVGPPSGFVDDKRRIWRYMNMDKFEYLLSHKMLYCCRADRFWDRAEGYCPNVTSANLVRTELMEFAYLQRRESYLSCWHLSEWESEAMWGLYTPRKEDDKHTVNENKGVALVAEIGSLARLCVDFEKSSKVGGTSSFAVAMGDVEYVDHRPTANSLGVELGNILFYKRKAYEHEKEFRLLVHLQKTDTDPDSVLLPVDLSTLIEEIVICPQASKGWPKEVYELADRFGLRGKVRPSLLDQVPNWEDVREKCEHDLEEMRRIRSKYKTLFPAPPQATVSN